MSAFDIIIYHNPKCSTSRTVLAFIKSTGFEPHIIEYLKTPPSVEMLLLLAVRSGVSIREFLREKEPSYKQFGLDNQTLSDEKIAEIMHAHPVLINRPIVVSPIGVKLCRPAEIVGELLVQGE